MIFVVISLIFFSIPLIQFYKVRNLIHITNLIFKNLEKTRKTLHNLIFFLNYVILDIWVSVVVKCSQLMSICLV